MPNAQTVSNTYALSLTNDLNVICTAMVDAPRAYTEHPFFIHYFCTDFILFIYFSVFFFFLTHGNLFKHLK